MGDEEDENSLPDIQVNGKTYKQLADGNYDVIVLSTGLNECVLAGLLAVRGMRVLQIDRNNHYGGECASLNLEELYNKHNKPFDKAQVEAKFGNPRRYCVDAVPKLLMANGKIVKMLLQTGVTRYMEFNGIAGSYVLNSGSIYKLPVTPTEALTSSLVGLFQKPYLKSFAEFIDKYQVRNKEADLKLANMPAVDFAAAITAYYKVHNPEKVAEVNELIASFAGRRPQLVSALERKYGLPVFPVETTLQIGAGPMGMRIEGQAIQGTQGNVKSVIRVVGFGNLADGKPGPVQNSGQVFPCDIISAVNGASLIGLSDKEAQEKITGTPRPMNLTFMHPTELETSTRVIAASANLSATQKYSQVDLRRVRMKDVYADFGLDENSQNFIGHAMALYTDDSYLEKPAEDTIEAVKLYGQSMGRYGQPSPYLYPMYGLSSLPEGFSRLSAIYGGTVMLRTNVDEILTNESGQCVGVRVGKKAASCKYVIGEASYLPKQKSKSTGRVIRSICLLKHPVKNTKGDSAQIILPSKHIPGKQQDVYISVVSHMHQVAPEGIFVAICSTTIETNDPISELKAAFKIIEPIEERFDTITETFGPTGDGSKDNIFVVPSLDATSHFEIAARDIETIYQSIFDKPLNLEEKLVKDQAEDQ